MIRRPPRSTLSSSSAASDVYKRQGLRRRTIAWQDIRTIEERRSWLHGRVVEIAPNTGKPITALVKASWLDDTFERDRRDLEQRWRAWTSASADGSPVSSPPR